MEICSKKEEDCVGFLLKVCCTAAGLTFFFFLQYQRKLLFHFVKYLRVENVVQQVVLIQMVQHFQNLEQYTTSNSYFSIFISIKKILKELFIVIKIMWIMSMIQSCRFFLLLVFTHIRIYGLFYGRVKECSAV